MFDVRLPNLRWLEERGSMDSILNADPTNEQGMILFYGPSNFTRWKHSKLPHWDHRPLEEEIRMKDGSQACVNHGFGTSTAEELLYYYPRLVRPWNPRALVTGTLGNDLAAGYSAGEVMTILARVLEWARKDFPGIKLFLTSRGISPNYANSKPERQNKYDEYDRLLRYYCDTHDDVTLIDYTKYPALFLPGHEGDYNFPNRELFVPDGHFNQAGYDVYRDIFLDVLDELL
ncbi:MAG: hypothetical protein IJP02_05375 [Oscillospiraceae bacterium]|nr:hypothetical protein [Oscillospiraceae bacterium]